MSKVKLKNYGLKDIMYFTNKPKEREKRIEAASSQKSGAVFKVNEKAAERHPEQQEFVIEKITDRGEGVKSYTLRKKDGTNPAFFRAGQYVVIRQEIDGKLIARPVSISSGPVETLDGTIEVTVKLVPDGFLSKYIIANWKVGDEVKTSGPQGLFYYEGFRDEKKVVACSGGSGITPILSMAKAIASGDEDFELTVLYGSKNRNEILFADEFAEVMAKTDKVKLVNVLSEEEAEGYESGFITADLIKKYAGDDKYSLFASGPQVMYEFLDKETDRLGLDLKHYRKEIFGSVKQPWTLPGYPAEAKDKVFNLKVKMCNKEYEIPCNANENMLVALERAGIAGPNRCRGGVCGWCRSRLISGEVFIPELTDRRRGADKKYGYIHPCASFAISDCEIEVPNNK
ncbi:MAG: iron-sulfur cluster-binding domain-containing protein [Clostridiales bacterium]|nr:iron-sulfur cluster-binding domain-containing protein [Candidatus Crickella caballi]